MFYGTCRSTFLLFFIKKRVMVCPEHWEKLLLSPLFSQGMFYPSDHRNNFRVSMHRISASQHFAHPMFSRLDSYIQKLLRDE